MRGAKWISIILIIFISDLLFYVDMLFRDLMLEFYCQCFCRLFVLLYLFLLQ